jgi:hypothetical protein
MNMKKRLIVLIVGFAVLASVSASWAKELLDDHAHEMYG